MSNNYPDGVTGNEPEIAGYPEGSMAVTCASSADLVTLHAVKELVEDLTRRYHSNPTLALADIADGLDNLLVIAGDCEWEGNVEGYYADGVVFIWTCPNCGAENELELDDGADDVDPYDD